VSTAARLCNERIVESTSQRLRLSSYNNKLMILDFHLNFLYLTASFRSISPAPVFPESLNASKMTLSTIPRSWCPLNIQQEHYQLHWLEKSSFSNKFSVTREANAIDQHIESQVQPPISNWRKRFPAHGHLKQKSAHSPQSKPKLTSVLIEVSDRAQLIRSVTVDISSDSLKSHNSGLFSIQRSHKR